MLVQRIIEELFPKRCLVCKTPTLSNQPICPLCTERIKPLQGYCTACGMPLKSGIFHGCGNCIGEKFYFDKIISLYRYQEVENIIKAFKYTASQGARKTIKELLYRAIVSHKHTLSELKKAEIITFVPSHWLRMLTREFNQSEEIAKMVGELLEKPVKRLLRRTRYTPPQASMNKKMRTHNPKNSFQSTSTHAKHIVLVDDIATTLATLNEASKALKEAGNPAITCLVFARAT